MIMVRLFKLVFNQNRLTCKLIFANNITTIIANKLFRINIRQRKIHFFSKSTNVLFFSKPL